MTDVSAEFVRVLLAWVETLEPDMERVALGIGEASDEEWEAVTASLAAPFEADIINRVIHRAHQLLARKPHDARRLARLALRMTPHINLDTCSDPHLVEGDAWRECAAAHLEMAEFADAYDAVCVARACYSRSPSSRINAAILMLLEGRSLFELGRADEALVAVERGSSELLDSGADRKKYVQARTIHASILVGMGLPGAALDVFSDAADLARKAGDKETLAYILSNAGLCAAKLAAKPGDLERAKRCFDSALRYFDNLGLRAEMPHVRAALVTILKQQGRYNEAISELFKVRAEFLSLDIPVAAALAALRIVEVLLLCGRTAEISAICDEMLRTLTAARLEKNLLVGLAYVAEVARERRLEESDVTYVAAFIEKAERDADHTFVKPV
jgi:tetratricopeptide (TPR) repeat protein